MCSTLIDTESKFKFALKIDPAFNFLLSSEGKPGSHQKASTNRLHRFQTFINACQQAQNDKEEIYLRTNSNFKLLYLGEEKDFLKRLLHFSYFAKRFDRPVDRVGQKQFSHFQNFGCWGMFLAQIFP